MARSRGGGSGMMRQACIVGTLLAILSVTAGIRFLRSGDVDLLGAGADMRRVTGSAFAGIGDIIGHTDVGHMQDRQLPPQQQAQPRNRAADKCMGAPSPWQPFLQQQATLSFGGGFLLDRGGLSATGGPQARRSRSLLATGQALTALQALWKVESPSLGPKCNLNMPWKARSTCMELRSLRRCDLERKGKTRGAFAGSGGGRGASADERVLAACLLDARACTASADQLADVASRLTGVKMLLEMPSKQPKCVVHNTAKKCRDHVANAETGMAMGCGEEHSKGPVKGCDSSFLTNPAGIPRARTDLLGRHGRCAVVGNSLRMLDVQNGPSIDAHEAVFRFNFEEHVIERALHRSAGDGPPSSSSTSASDPNMRGAASSSAPTLTSSSGGALGALTPAQALVMGGSGGARLGAAWTNDNDGLGGNMDLAGGSTPGGDALRRRLLSKHLRSMLAAANYSDGGAAVLLSQQRQGGGGGGADG
eukprot:jgi/Mesvir1/7555/Mv19297-RA.1